MNEKEKIRLLALSMIDGLITGCRREDTEEVAVAREFLSQQVAIADGEQLAMFLMLFQLCFEKTS